MSEFPDDENGAVLRRMAARGTNLVSPRVVEFEHCFPDATTAKAFLTAVQETVLEARLIPPDLENGSGWEVQCRERMIPTHTAITQTEQRLAHLASRFGGYADGWGSMSDPDGSPT